MASVTQTIGSYNGGISQQPDELKIPGQVKDAVNVLPDLTHGLLKRPGGRMIGNLQNGEMVPGAAGKWFHYYRDEDEQYIGQVIRRAGHSDDGKIRMWRCDPFTECQVLFGSAGESALKSYLQHLADSDIQTLTLNDYTYITNRTKRTEMSTEDLAPARSPEAFIELKSVSYGKQYSFSIYDSTTQGATYDVHTATRIKIEREYDSSNGCESNGQLPSSGFPDEGNKCTHTASGAADSYCPNVATDIFAITHGASGNPEDANNTNYTFSVTPASGNASDRKDLYIRISTRGQSMPSDGTSPVYWCRYTTTHDLLYGGTGWITNDVVYVWMKNAKYKITVLDHSTSKIFGNLGIIRPAPTSFEADTVVTADSILGDLRAAIDASTFVTGSGGSVSQIGNGLYISKPSGGFNVSTPSGELLNVLTDTVETVADLPRQCKHGYVVRISNTEEKEDDYYVKFVGNNDKDGEGVWEECPQPGRMIKFNPATMPIQLVRTATNTFTLNQIAWDDCPVGDEVTVPKPSFMSGYGTPDTTELDPTADGYTTLDTSRERFINKLLFFRNRMILLSDENVNMSRPGDFYNFWPKTALTFTATDNIDISCSSEYPAVVYDGIQVNTGLILFTKNQQFMLTTDSDILSPQTAKINAMSTYNFNFDTNPISLGTTIGFLDNAGKNTRFFEMTAAQREGQPDIVEQTKIVSKLFPKGIDLIANSRENSVIFFCEKGTSTLYGYRYFQSVEKRIQNAWFKWTLSGNVQHIAMLDDALHAVIKNGDNHVIQKFSIKLEDSSNMLVNDLGTSDTDDDIEYRIHLDNAVLVPHTSLTYDDTPGNKYTWFTIPSGFNYDTGQLAVIWLPTGNDNTLQGMSQKVYKYFDLNSSDTRIKMSGNWKTYDPQGVSDGSITDDVTPTGNLVLGYLYDMEVKLPTIYLQKEEGANRWRSETHSSLVVHRVKFSFGPLGVYETVIDRVGRPTYTELHESVMADAYNANQVQFTPDSKKTVPIYEKNTNLTLTLKSSHPSPATLVSMTWEGDFNPKYYRRA